MKSNTKKTVCLFAVFFLAAVLLTGVQLVGTKVAVAENDSANIGRTYYYQELKNSPMAQKFYNLMQETAKDGKFKSGRYECDLVAAGVVTEAELIEYVDSSKPTIPVAFGAARDAFYMDNPDLFYVDVYKLYLSAGMQNNKYVAFMGTGRAENYFTEYTVKTEADVTAAVQKYEAALEKVVNDAKANSTDAVKQIEFVNAYIAENTEYDYGAREGLSGGIEYDGYVNTAYGSLVNGKALCGGYARAFKAVMDRLDIPCVLIQGSAVSGKTVVDAESKETLEAGAVAHMWNAVELNGLWYGVDVTYNAGADLKRYLLVGDDNISKNHFTDGVISSSGFELQYPALRPFDYGVNEDESGFEFKDEGKIGDFEFGYKNIEVEDGTKSTLDLGVSYMGKNIDQLKAEGKYLAVQYTNRVGAMPWYDMTVLYADVDITHEKFTAIPLDYSVASARLAIVDFSAGEFPGLYDEDALTDAHILAISTVYTNKGFGTYYAPPRAIRRSPSYFGTIRNMQTLDVSLTYSEKLVQKDGSAIASFDDLGFRVKGAVHDDVEKYVVIENPQWDNETSTLTFRFTPSKQYSHNMDTYMFLLENTMGETSKKEPEPAGYYSFKMKDVVCPKVFNDGRLYMQVFGQPQFVSADDQSLNGFKDENGQPIVGDQRSQLMLVVNEPTKAENTEMENALLKDSEIGLEKEDIKASSTYQIDLHMCGLVQKVPAGSFMQVGFGFPDGYGPEDKGVTFTVYHYKRDAAGKITEVEAVPCVITEYGIIATVRSFSPFMICAVDASKVTKKSVCAMVDGVGGKVSDTTVRTIAENGSVTYTFTAEDGYRLDRVLLNGKDVTANAGGGSITVSYDDLGEALSAMVEVSFVAERVSEYYAENGIVIVQPKIVVSGSDMIVAVPHDPIAPSVPAKNGNMVGIIVGICVAVFLVAVAAGVVAYFLLQKKKGGKKAA